MKSTEGKDIMFWHLELEQQLFFTPLPPRLSAADPLNFLSIKGSFSACLRPSHLPTHVLSSDSLVHPLGFVSAAAGL